MAITVVNSGGNFVDSVTSFNINCGTVTSGNLLVVMLVAAQPADDNFVASDLNRFSGASVGTITLDRTSSQNPVGTDWQYTGIFSAPILSSGALVMVAGTFASGYFLYIWAEVSGVDVSASRVESFNSNNSPNGNNAPGTNIDSGNATSANSAIFFGVCSNWETSTNTLTKDAAFTEIFKEQNGSAHMTGGGIYRIVTTGTTDSASWTQTPQRGWSASVAVYKFLSGNRTGPLPLYLPGVAGS